MNAEITTSYSKKNIIELTNASAPVEILCNYEIDGKIIYYDYPHPRGLANGAKIRLIPCAAYLINIIYVRK